MKIIILIWVIIPHQLIGRTCQKWWNSRLDGFLFTLGSCQIVFLFLCYYLNYLTFIRGVVSCTPLLSLKSPESSLSKTLSLFPIWLLNRLWFSFPIWLRSSNSGSQLWRLSMIVCLQFFMQVNKESSRSNKKARYQQIWFNQVSKQARKKVQQGVILLGTLMS